MPVDPNAPTEENEPVSVPMPPRRLSRGFVALVAVIVFVGTLLVVVGIAVLMSQLKR